MFKTMHSKSPKEPRCSCVCVCVCVCAPLCPAFKDHVPDVHIMFSANNYSCSLPVQHHVCV